MVTVSKIERIREMMQVQPLSLVIPEILSIALELKDYDGFYLLELWMTPFSSNKEINKIYHEEIWTKLVCEGLDDEEINSIGDKAKRKYAGMSAIEDRKCMALTVKELEDAIRRSDQIISALDVPQGLHPVDLFFKHKESAEAKLKVIECKRTYETMLSSVGAYVIAKLTEYQRMASKEEEVRYMDRKIAHTKKVFIIHGHNEAKWRELEALLKDKWGLIPVVLSEQPDHGQTIIEKFEKYANDCEYAFALFTPDDIVSSGGKEYFQARPNVIFELGWFYAKLGRSRVCVLDQASEGSKIFSDLQGVMRMQFNQNVSERYMEIERELKSVGVI